ncbi:fumarylacetoacetate hydrolase family protein [Bacteroidales bacterium OttesenSCG-928-B11]|nr:fumarylacetoacetate hydrolase family protein [Bacteroidales bacterium OttesenSCG-928-E04]MDL2308466.1 fumarylacetoacetate hydrolase family protein [Bacteroidales bacterium OttesenSCG-928-C03]MDL2311449.1 fumarylacetoacetate hydrolase family protein [Bacteroidales bacterium OttesenSCG-928-B11]
MKFICIGRNYADHIHELGHQKPEKPLFFLKPDSAVLQRNRPFFYPDFSKDLHYEVELLVKINKLGKCIQPKFAHTYYQEIGLGIDFTARDIQKECIEKGLPWEMAKAFDNSAVLGKFFDKSYFPDLNNINFSLFKNEEKVQEGNSGNMIFHIDYIISYVSQFMTLKIGDIIFTGTPEGVGPVHINDRLEGFIENEKVIDFRIK